MNDPTNAFHTWESNLHNRLGISANRMRELRQDHLQEGVHWAKTGRRISYSDEGVETAAKILQTAPENLPPAAQKATEDSEHTEAEKAPQEQDGGLVGDDAPKFQIVSVVSQPKIKKTGHHFKNKSLILAKTAEGQRVYVRVKDSKNFRPIGTNRKPMKIKALPGPGLWHMVGKCPRFPGKF